LYLTGNLLLMIGAPATRPLASSSAAQTPPGGLTTAMLKLTKKTIIALASQGLKS
jgi:hypothetical protein